MIRVVDGEWVEAPEATELPTGVPGVFETVLLREGQPVFWTDHWARFIAGCDAFALSPPLARDALLDLAQAVAVRNGVTDGVLRFAAWTGVDATLHWQMEATPPRPHMRKTEFTATWGPVVPAAANTSGFKHLDRGAWLTALREARRAGADEVLLRNRSGDIVEAAVSNVFLVHHAVTPLLDAAAAPRLLTPPLSAGALAGVMRSRVLGFARTLGWDVREATVTPANVAAADEVWLTNSLIGIRPVTRIGDQQLVPNRPALGDFRARWKSRYGWDPVVRV